MRLFSEIVTNPLDQPSKGLRPIFSLTLFLRSFFKPFDTDARTRRAGDVESMARLTKAITFNGGGHINHSIFWQNLCPKKDYRPPQGALLAKIDQDFGSLEKLQASLTQATVGLQGSGWGWLGYHKETDQLYVKTMANQNPLQCGTPLLGIDAWEHAYYLQYKNVRPDYVKAIWEVVNWADVEARFEASSS